MKLRFLAAAALAALTLALSACSASIQGNVEELLQPPQLSAEQTAVYETLRDYVGQSIKLKYPVSGDYRSAFTFRDIDGDGADEAIVFYSVPDSATAWICTLRSGDAGTWQISNLLSGDGADVEFLRFSRMFSTGAENIVVGWGLESAEKRLAVYSYAGDALTPLYEGLYQQIAVDDFNLDTRDEILIISAARSRSRPSVRLLAADGDTLDVQSTVYLRSDISSCLAPVIGGISREIKGIVMDCYTESDALCTAVVQVSGFKLRVLLGDGDEDLAATARAESIFCSDINGDGIIEIPQQTAAPGHDAADPDTCLYLTRYCTYDVEAEGKLSPVVTAFVNPEAGYRFRFPDDWLGSEISLYRQRETGEITFFLYAGDLYNHSRELLRLRVNRTSDYQDKFDTAKYFLVGSRGIFEYYAALTAPDGDALALTRSELETLFSLIN